MKRAALFVFIVFCTLHHTAHGQSSKKVLFLGNSYTYFNSMPQLAAGIAANMGDTLVYDSNTPDGYTLQQHFANTTSTNKIKAGGWDYVIMQEQSQLPSFQEYNYLPAYNLSALIRKHNPCARILYFMTWGRKNGDASNCAAWPPVCTYKGMDSLLRLRYTETAIFTEAGLSPAGAAWRYVRENYPNIELYQTDGSHPTLAGSYIAACTFYTSIFKKDPTQITYGAGLSFTDAAAIRQAVKAIVYDSLPQWDFGKYIPKAQFYYTIGSGTNEVIFNNATENADSVVWDFGDGNSSGIISPVHQYATEGTYTVKLTAINCDLGITHVSTQQVTVTFCAHSPRIVPDDLLLCPNEKDTLWTQVYDAYQWLDEAGDTIPGETRQYIIPQPGSSYSVLARSNNCTEQSPRVSVRMFVNLAFYSVNAEGKFIAPDTLCTGDTLTLSLMPNKPPYPDDKYMKWYKNGVLIPASENDTLQVTQTGQYHATLYTPVCPNYLLHQSTPVLYTFLNCNNTSVPTLAQPGIMLYPNPVADVLQVQAPVSLAGHTYSITNIWGKTLQTGALESKNNTIPVFQLGSGLYLIYIQGNTFKFIKE